jgi:hypothetical protein
MAEAVATERTHAEKERRRVRWALRPPLHVASARLRAHPLRGLLVATGVAAAVAALVGVAGGSLAARDRAVQRAVAALPVSQRSFRVDAFGLAPGQDYRSADRLVRRSLATLTPSAPLPGTFFRELRVGGGLVKLAGLDGLDRLVRLRSGRRPRECGPARCEVVQIGGGSRSAWSEDGLNVVRVGIGSLPDRTLFGGSLDTVAENNGERPVLLLAAGADALGRLPALAGIYRSYGWIAPIVPKRLHVWAIDGLLRREASAQARLAAYSDAYELTGPDDALAAARASGRVSAQRMLLIGGELGALLLGFALVSALGLRRGLAAEQRRLQQRGALTPQLWLALGAEVTALTLGGALAGLLGGAGLVALAAGGDVLGHAASRAAWLAAAGWLAATAAVVFAVRLPEREERPRRVGLLDVTALGAAGAVALGFARGALSADALSSGGDAVLLLLLPGLICLIAAVLAARLLAPAMRGAERFARRGPIALRLALLALARGRARTLATSAFLLVGIGLALFAATYRTTLERSARDEAAFAVPLDYTASEGSALVLPLDAAPLADWGDAYPIVRRLASVPGPGTSALSPTVLGVPAVAVARLHWRSDFGPAPAELARRLGPPARFNAVALPPGAREVSLAVRLTGVAVRIDLALLDDRSRVLLAPLGQPGPGLHVLTARLPAGAARVAGLELSLADSTALGLTHREAETGAASALSGALRLGVLDAGGRVVANWRGWTARGGATLHASRVAYTFSEGQTMLLRLPQPTDREPLRVLASPAVARGAGPGGTLTLDFQDVRVPARIVAVVRRFPAAEQSDEGFVVADQSRLQTALDARLPGLGTPGELWISGPPQAEATLRRPPFSSLDLASRRDLQRSLASDPLARAIVITLGAAAAVALALAVIGLWVALVSDLRDERGELFDLEAQGVAPATLRRQFRLRAATLVALGVVAGAVLGLVLSRLVVALVRVSGATETPNPPLRLDPAWLLSLAGLAALVVAAAAVVELATRRAFRGDSPEHAAWSLE